MQAEISRQAGKQKRLDNYYNMMDMVTCRIAKSTTVTYGVLALMSIHIVQNTVDTATEAHAAR